MMACHLNTEDDALRIIQLLCRHRFYAGQARCVDVDAKDYACNTPLHHAALTNKLAVCQYLINEEKADTSPKNAEDQLAIDITTAQPVFDFLSEFQKQSPVKKKKQNPLGKIMSVFRSSKSSIAEEESKDGFRDPSTMYFNDELVAANSGRRTIDIRNSEHRQAGRQAVSLSDFNIIDMLGSGSFGSVYTVTLGGQRASKGKQKYYAMKILDKDKVYKQNLARYALTERNVLSVAGKHPMMVGLDYAF